jgi:hypothetical protein
VTFKRFLALKSKKCRCFKKFLYNEHPREPIGLLFYKKLGTTPSRVLFPREVKLHTFGLFVHISVLKAPRVARLSFGLFVQPPIRSRTRSRPIDGIQLRSASMLLITGAIHFCIHEIDITFIGTATSASSHWIVPFSAPLFFSSGAYKHELLLLLYITWNVTGFYAHPILLLSALHVGTPDLVLLTETSALEVCWFHYSSYLCNVIKEIS